VAKKLTKVEFTNLEKILYPELKITKAKMIEYYIRMAPKMLGLLANRPIVLTRYPNGVHEEGFYEKDAPAGTPPWVETFKLYSETAHRETNYIVCNDLDTLVWLANLAALEIHIPLSTTKSPDNPDLILFDLDPEPPANITDAVDVALLLKEKLENLGYTPYVKTTGKKGLHVVIPIASGHTFKQTRNFVHKIARSLAQTSKIIASESTRTKPPGTITIDYAQNSHGRTMISPYSLRVTPQATVSTPLEWKDIAKGLKPEMFTIFTVPRIEKNPWQDLLENRQKLEVMQE
jgi:bifunctional non-homologous end joining protein LigD